MDKAEGYFVGHCDDEDCVFGAFEYTCPCCETYNIDYQVWWEQENISCDTFHEFNCDNCNEELKVYFDNDEFEYIVEKK